MRFFILLFSIASFSMLSVTQSHAQSNSSESNSQNIRYISDELFIFMHAGPGRNFRILGSINAGTTISLLQVDEDAGYSKIKDDRERTGWVESKFVSNTPSIRVSFEEVSKKLNEQQKGYTTMQKKMNTALRELTESEQQKSLLDQNLSKTLKKNAELEKRLAQQDSKVQIEWFTRGAIVVIASIIIGYLLGLFGRKRRKSNPLM